MQELKKNKIPSGIYAEEAEWKKIFGDYCQFLGTQPLLWVPL